MWPSASGQPAYGCICSYHGNDNAIFTAVVFNSGTRGESQSGACRRESAPANEKAIWGELAYWHQAWRQREAVRSGSPNDRSLWTSARRYNSPSLLSIAFPILSITRVSDLNPFPSSLATPVVSQSAAHLIPHRGSCRHFLLFNNWLLFFFPKFTQDLSLGVAPLSSSWIIRQWFTDLESNSALHPTTPPHTHSGWGLLWLRRPQSKVFWSGLYRLPPAIYLYWPKLWHRISHYYILPSIQKGVGGGFQLFWPLSHPVHPLRLPSLCLKVWITKLPGCRTLAI